MPPALNKDPLLRRESLALRLSPASPARQRRADAWAYALRRQCPVHRCGALGVRIRVRTPGLLRGREDLALTSVLNMVEDAIAGCVLVLLSTTGVGGEDGAGERWGLFVGGRACRRGSKDVGGLVGAGMAAGVGGFNTSGWGGGRRGCQRMARKGKGNRGEIQ